MCRDVSPATSIMGQDFTIVNEDKDRALGQAGAQLASIEDLVTCLEHAEECDWLFRT